MLSNLDISPAEMAAAGAALNPLDMEVLCAMPRLMSDVSAWVQHIPFAFALVQLLRPRTIVELGTHKGDSYCAMCQAVDMLGLETRCTAVDTWRGDPQCGPYDETILQELRAHHDPRYGRFSSLLQSTFDAAIGEFADGVIDLLHLDGLHDYAAVRHDFFTWLPKLSDHAVVLIHDTQVRSSGFEVYRLWEELRGQYPSFAFEHGYGLGVLAVGADMSDEVRAFLAAADASPQGVRDLFGALGQRLELQRGLALLANDVAMKEEYANAWRAGTGQPLRRTLPDTPYYGTGELPHDLKRALDALHETSTNQGDDLRAVIADNGNLRAACAAIRGRTEAIVESPASKDCAMVSDIHAIMVALDRLANERQQASAHMAELRRWIDALLEEQRKRESTDISALLARAIAERWQRLGNRFCGAARIMQRMVARKAEPPKIVGVSRRVPPL